MIEALSQIYISEQGLSCIWLMAWSLLGTTITDLLSIIRILMRMFIFWLKFQWNFNQNINILLSKIAYKNMFDMSTSSGLNVLYFLSESFPLKPPTFQSLYWFLCLFTLNANLSFPPLHLRPGDHFTNKFLLNIKIQWKICIAVLQSDCKKIWQMPQQHSCRVMCKVLLR